MVIISVVFFLSFFYRVFVVHEVHFFSPWLIENENREANDRVQKKIRRLCEIFNCLENCISSFFFATVVSYVSIIDTKCKFYRFHRALYVFKVNAKIGNSAKIVRNTTNEMQRQKDRWRNLSIANWMTWTKQEEKYNFELLFFSVELNVLFFWNVNCWNGISTGNELDSIGEGGHFFLLNIWVKNAFEMTICNKSRDDDIPCGQNVLSHNSQCD